MRFLRRFLKRLANSATRQSADQRLQDEIAEHLAFQTEENLRAGMSPAEARRQAALKLGAAQAIREHPHEEDRQPGRDERRQRHQAPAHGEDTKRTAGGALARR